jgi:hypothetical protein
LRGLSFDYIFFRWFTSDISPWICTCELIPGEVERRITGSSVQKV